MAQTLSELVQQSRLIVVEVDKSRSRVRVRGTADACTDLACSERALVVSDEGAEADLDLLNPGDIVKIEPAVGPVEKIIVVRRVWEEIASPEI
ncbi:MAG: hypothetical protein HYU25_17195 [Candidatus Rokubacteria bacterium]|nr:hypothetical protein [Candidatus Rokubacteria bacterium]